MKLKYKVILPTAAVLTSALLAACGGGGLSIAEGGISGTGITTVGRITNFGSIFVNGVRFEVDNASFTRDGAPSSGQAEFSVGEFVVIKGSVDAVGTSGIADEVTFTDEIEGAVTVASSDNKTIEILGQTVITDQLTVFIGFNALSDLIGGNIVEVSGVRDSAGVIKATSIKLKETVFIDGVSENELKGIISNLDPITKTFMINNITIEFGNAILEDFGEQGPQNGQFVEVKSNTPIVGNILQATEVELEDEVQTFEEEADVEIEGQVTRFVSASDFDVNGIAVSTNTSTQYENGNESNILSGAFMEVEGTVDASGVLIANSIEFKETESTIELEGNINSIDIALNQLVVSGETIVLDASTIMVDGSDSKVSPLTIGNLSITDKIKVNGFRLSNGNILASKLERKEVLESDENSEEDNSEEDNSEEDNSEEDNSEEDNSEEDNSEEDNSEEGNT